MSAQDREYYLRRASQEDEAALNSGSLSARWRHEELASLYRLRAEQLARTDEAAAPESVVPAFILTSEPPKIEAA